MLQRPATWTLLCQVAATPPAPADAGRSAGAVPPAVAAGSPVGAIATEAPPQPQSACAEAFAGGSAEGMPGAEPAWDFAARGAPGVCEGTVLVMGMSLESSRRRRAAR